MAFATIEGEEDAPFLILARKPRHPIFHPDPPRKPALGLGCLEDPARPAEKAGGLPVRTPLQGFRPPLDLL
ncbi:hypothetical protein ASG43_19825 [Aureimonas sp. Leaf454]|nr:hypothetical protein ASG43_19825 [Aureimonas sp. Leaf454]